MTPARRAAAGIVGIAFWAGAMASAAADADPAHPAAPQAPHSAAKPAAKPAPSKPQAAPWPAPRAAPAAATRTDAPAARHGLWRVPARPLSHGLFDRDPAGGGAEGRQSDGAARRLYSNGLGVQRDDKKAAEWYQLAADRGDRGRCLPSPPALRRPSPTLIASRGQCSPPPPSSAISRPPISAFSISRVSCFHRTSRAQPSCSAAPRKPEARGAQYALATLYKEGRGVPKDTVEAVRLLAMASLADNTDGNWNMPSLCSTGRASPRTSGWRRSPAKAARKGNPVAQNRLANIPAVGRGVQANPVLAIKWHIVAKTGGVSDIPLDTFVQGSRRKSAPRARRRRSPTSTPSRRCAVTLLT